MILQEFYANLFWSCTHIAICLMIQQEPFFTKKYVQLFFIFWFQNGLKQTIHKGRRTKKTRSWQICLSPLDSWTLNYYFTRQLPLGWGSQNMYPKKHTISSACPWGSGVIFLQLHKTLFKTQRERDRESRTASAAPISRC